MRKVGLGRVNARSDAEEEPLIQPPRTKREPGSSPPIVSILEHPRGAWKRRA